MDPVRWSRIREALESVLDAPTGERTAVIELLCPDPGDRAEVRSLLAAETGTLPDPPNPAAAADLLEALEGARLVGTMLGPYRLVELIATGGMGEVFRAERGDGTFERVVAVKLIRRGMMSPEARRRFDAERRVLARLAHPNIAALLDGGEAGGRPYIVLEYIEGVSLREFCRRESADVRTRVALLRTICHAVAHAHRNLVVHRDLKPANVLVTPAAEPKLLDFGIAKLLAPEPVASQTATQVLTPRYASPEQLRGEPVTTASDVYSLGVLLHEALTGGHGAEPESGTHPTRLGCDPAPPSRSAPEVDRELDAIALQALAQEPGERYPSAEAMAADLERYLRGERVLAYPATRSYLLRKWAGRHRVVLGVAASLALVVSGAAVVAGAMAARLSWQRSRTLEAQHNEERVSRFLGETLEFAGQRGLDGQLTLGLLLDDAAAKLEREVAAAPAVSGPIHAALGRTYHAMGRTADGQRHLAQAVQELAASVGNDDARTVEAREDYARALMLAGRFTEAEAEFSAAIAARRPMNGDGAARPLYGMGMSRMIQSDNDGARRYFDEALAAAPQESALAATILESCGELAIHEGRAADAVELRQRAVALRERLAGPDALETAESRGMLAGALAAAERPDEAEPLARSSLELVRQRAGAARAAGSASLRTLARILEQSGHPDDADALYRGAIDDLAAALPGSRHQWVYIRENYALFLMRQWRYEEAQPHLEEAVRTYKELLGDQHQRTRMAALALRETTDAIARGMSPIPGGP